MKINKKLKSLRRFRSEQGSLGYAILRKLSRGRLKRQLLIRTDPKFFNHSARRINRVMSNREFSYLEIGVAQGTTLQSVNSKEKHGVDPNPLFNVKRLPENTSFDCMTSDAYFKIQPSNVKFDFIFLDGLHESNQLLRDLHNSLKHVKPGGWILVDDVIPSDSISAFPDIDESYSMRGVSPIEGFPWHGDCYKILPIVFNTLKSVEPFIIIYPDNPQLLLRTSNKQHEINDDVKTITELDSSSLNFQYHEVFSRENISHYPIYIEEILINDLINKSLIKA